MLFVFVMVWYWSVYPCLSRLLLKRRANNTISPIPVKRPWRLGENGLHAPTLNWWFNQIKHISVKPCVNYMGYILHQRARLSYLYILSVFHQYRLKQFESNVYNISFLWHALNSQNQQNTFHLFLKMFQSRIYVTEHTWHMIAPLRIAYQGNKFILQWPDNSKPGVRSRTLEWHMASINITFHDTYFAPKTIWKHSRFPFQSPTAVTMYKLPPNSQYTIF